MYSHQQLLSIQERIASDEKNLQKKKELINQSFHAFNAQSLIRDIWQGSVFIEVPDTTGKIGNDEYAVNLAFLPVVLMTRFCDWLIDVSNHCAEEAAVNGEQKKLL